MNAFPDKPIPEPEPDERKTRAQESAALTDPDSSSTPSIVPPASAKSGTDIADHQAEPTLVAELRDPAWSGFDVLRLVFLATVALFLGVFSVLLAAHLWIRPHSSLADLARVPLIVVAGQALAYLLVLAYMYVLVTRERGRPNFLSALHWNWPRNIVPYLAAGAALSLALQGLAHILPMPKNLPIDIFFRTQAEAWALTVFGVTLAPLMEEFFFRGFLYPVLARGIGFTAAIFVTAFAFALLHGAQLMFSWGPVLVIFLVGVVLTMVRAYKNSVAAGLLIHVAYNGTISALMFVATDGFRHLEKLSQ